jgi:two-component system copper resistance phosphate regulon response regulator CusR
MRVLVVDDDPEFRSKIRRGLEESGMECTAVQDSDEAARALATGAVYDAILLEVMLPGRSGWKWLEELRRGGSETPVIFVTARHEVEERVKGLRLGADDYIVKPFDFNELLARIEAVVRRRQASPIVEAGELRIDLGRRIVERSGVRIEMSPREFAVLQALVEARGKTLSRAELLEGVWGIAFDPGTNVVDVVVARLRRKLGGPAQRTIQTIVGEGYRFGEARASAP